MQFLKQSLLALSLLITIAPIGAMNKNIRPAPQHARNVALHDNIVHQGAPLEQINMARVQKAKNKLAREARWAKPARYALAGAALVAAGYSAYTLYQYLKTPVPTMSEKGYEFFKSLSTNDQKNINENIATYSKSLHDAIDAAKNTPGWFTWLGNIANNQISNFGSIVAFGLTAKAAASSQEAITSHIPTTGTLHWYMTNRTDYDRNFNDALRYLSFYELFQNEVTEVIRLMTFDIEKALGYLNNFEQILTEQKSPEYIMKTCVRHRTNIELLTNKLVDAVNAGSPMANIAETLHLIDAELRSAKGFVAANYK